MSVPNQRIIHIIKPAYKKEFLQIGITEWQQAQREMTYGEFCLYLYLAGNANGFDLELSQAAFEKATGFKKTTYHDAVKKLTTLGYLTYSHGNTWDFHTTPVRPSGSRQSEQKIPQKRIEQSVLPNQVVRPSNIEIDNINKTNKIDNLSNSCFGETKDWLTEFNQYATDPDTAQICSYLTELSLQRKMDYLNTVQSINKSAFWLKKAIQNKPVTDWEKHGFGLLRSAGYVEEIDEIVEKIEQKQRRLAEGFAKQQEAMARQEKIVLPQRSKQSIRSRAIDLNNIE
jgi:hypothetical protein